MTCNFLVVGDLHLRKSSPSTRIDDFIAAQEAKLDFIFETAREYDCLYLVFPGDVFDRADCPHGLTEWAIRKFLDFMHRGSRKCLFVYGQHDLRYHTSDKLNSPLGVLIAALGDYAQILTPTDGCGISFPEPRILVRGCSWGEPIPTKIPKIDEKGQLNILVLHRPIINAPVQWEHKDMLTTKQLFKASPDTHIFICGDNHQTFTVVDKNRRMVINTGSVMRTNIGQVDHAPVLGVLSVQESRDFSFLPVSIPHKRGVFDLETEEERRIQEERVVAFVDGLSQDFDPELSFRENIRVAVENAPRGVRELIAEVLQ